MEFVISEATRSELPDVFKLVKALADYENAPEAVTSTILMYQAAFDAKQIFIDVAKIDNKIIGFALYYLTFSTWKGKMMYLEDFFVEKEFRGNGIGSSLFDRFILKSKSLDCVLTKWQVLDWNKTAIDFYEARNARIQKEWWNCLIDL